jgi:hypothetical protein
MKTLAALLALAVLAGPSFDEAKADKAKRADWLKAAVAKLPLKGAYLLGDEAQNKAAMDAVKAEYKADGREVFFTKESKKVLAPTEAPSVRAVVYYREGIDVGAGQKSGILLVGDLFALASEAEAQSILEDYIGTFVKYAEGGIKIGDKEVDTLVPALKQITYTSLIKSLAQAVQVQAILTGARKVSDGFKDAAVKEYQITHRQFLADLAKQKKIYDDNNENTLQKEIWDSLEMVKTHLAETLGKAGYEHVVKADGDVELKKK